MPARTNGGVDLELELFDLGWRWAQFLEGSGRTIDSEQRLLAGEKLGEDR